MLIKSWHPIATPLWWTEELRRGLDRSVNPASPVEKFGFFVRDSFGQIHLRTMTVCADQRNFRMDPGQVVSFCYELLKNHMEVAGTYHSHPKGHHQEMTEADTTLQLWGDVHALCFPKHSAANGWQIEWFSPKAV